MVHGTPMAGNIMEIHEEKCGNIWTFAIYPYISYIIQCNCVEHKDHIFHGEIHLMILDLVVQSNSAFADFEWMKPNTKGRSKDFGPDVFTGRVKCKSESAPSRLSLECTITMD